MSDAPIRAFWIKLKSSPLARTSSDIAFGPDWITGFLEYMTAATADANSAEISVRKKKAWCDDCDIEWLGEDCRTKAAEHYTNNPTHLVGYSEES